MKRDATSSQGGPRVAVIGSGIAGLAAAHCLRRHAAVTLFEAGDHFGGHAHTVDMKLDGVTHGVDTGFLVFNERTYPGLIALFEQLGVATGPSDMSFSVQVPGAPGTRGLEWSGNNLAGVFSQPSNAFRPGFWRMLRDLLRFNSIATGMAQAGADMPQPLAAFLDAHDFSAEFRDWYLLPMLGCIWSSPTDAMLRFPVGTLIRFCHNHGLLQVAGRPQWFTVHGGSREYVRRIVQGLPDARLRSPVHRIERGDDSVRIISDRGEEVFDKAVLAVHPDQALALLPDAGPSEREILGGIRYQPNRAVLHTDASVLPRSPRAWAAWNYEAGAGPARGRVCLHYLINKLQPLPWKRPVIVSLNPLREIDPQFVAGVFDYAHPVFDAAALRAQRRLGELQGRRGLWFCGAWTGYGFHEDGLASGEAAARSLLMNRAIDEVAEAVA